MLCKPILVVEDDEDIRIQIVQALEVEGYKVMVAENGKVALQILKGLTPSELPGCMILDLMMPEMDGKTLLDIITRDYRDRWGGIHVVIATAKGSPTSPEKVPNAVHRIQKPFELDELYSVVEKHCGKPKFK